MSAVMDAAAPIDRRERDVFLRDVFAELSKHVEIGPPASSAVSSPRCSASTLAPRMGHNTVGKWD
ncbi:hypothetical protein [Bradyrhizobium yuanmingense]|uniref:hypothetical protein n=1 Tax=Bradyrhizobium yuanmingense TaxID=108015 RepID=UPI001CD3AE79|nr:hypothetical protein [Bradyrhizobium yuanmingense]MCA1529736.1 hypothetical protein [Bradyrhizobium yuanmingense]